MIYNHSKMVSTLIAYDKREVKKSFYNRFALAIYLRALQDAESCMAAGQPMRQALIKHFNGRLLDNLLKAANQPVSTREEQRGF